MPPDPNTSPRSLRELASAAIRLTRQHEALFSCIDAQEATLRRCRELVEGWKIEAYAWAVGINPCGNQLDKALMGCARELEDILDGTAARKDGPQ